VLELLIDSDVNELLCSIVKDCEPKAVASLVRSRNSVHGQDFTSTAEFVVRPLLGEQRSVGVPISIGCFSLSMDGQSAPPSDYASSLIFGISLDLYRLVLWYFCRSSLQWRSSGL
jgi:hypothetical protein